MKGDPVDTQRIAALEDALSSSGFRGELTTDLASRVVNATDNSIYQILPAAVLYPRDGQDLVRLMQALCCPAFESLKLYPRGGGTSTNGQSLGAGVVVDSSRHMRRVLDYDRDTGKVRVEPGLVRDALNEFLEPFGRLFAPHVSTTDRATLGGMVSNDSSGKGSLVYGKTSDHVAAIEVVLPDAGQVTLERAGASRRDARTDEIREAVGRALAPYADEIRRRFPDMTRGFTGYNLLEARDEADEVDLVKLFAGSEGTLGLIESITLETVPIPARTVLIVLLYPSHDAGLRAIPALLARHPTAIEFIDDVTLGAALASPFADDVRTVLGIETARSTLAANFFELTGDDESVLERQVEALLESFASTSSATTRPTGWRVVRDREQIARVWEVRRACQGLLAGFDESRRATAFIEDAAVPPERLADFVAELSALLKARGVSFGMYGHADVGCVHVRPLMDLTDANERGLVRELSDAVFELTEKYGGLLWGEHGKGFRGEYSEATIGPDLYGVMRRIKSVFDPANRMNPGKIASPEGERLPLVALDTVPMRGQFDERLEPSMRREYAGVLRCDGNGACFGRHADVALCPSYQATGDRRLSPKGRAGMLREWLDARSSGDAARTRIAGAAAREVLDTCLACKACRGGGCSGRVDIAQMKAQFLAEYHRDHRRPAADFLVGSLERLVPVVDRLSMFGLNRLTNRGFVRHAMAAGLGLVDLPAQRSRRDFRRRLRALDVETSDVSALLRVPDADRRRTVVIVQDCFTSYFDTRALIAQLALVRELGFEPVLLAYREGGKPLHVKGFLGRFRHVAARHARDLAALHGAGLTLLGVDVATTLMYRHEYVDTLQDCPIFGVSLLSEWLETVELPTRSSAGLRYTLMQHCTERSLVPETAVQWARIFRKIGMDVRLVPAGCCGMSGLFGHEAAHQAISTTLYERRWRKVVESEAGDRLIATGYSCRSQVRRLSGMRALHPAEALLQHLATTAQ